MWSYPDNLKLIYSKHCPKYVAKIVKTEHNYYNYTLIQKSGSQGRQNVVDYRSSYLDINVSTVDYIIKKSYFEYPSSQSFFVSFSLNHYYSAQKSVILIISRNLPRSQNKLESSTKFNKLLPQLNWKDKKLPLGCTIALATSNIFLFWS